MIRFIAEHKDHQVTGPDGGTGLRWGVEPMCAVLSEHGVPISPSTYYEWVAKTPTRRQIRDAELVEIITAATEERKTGKFVQTLGSRKLWIWLRGQGHDVARCTVERIMGEQGWEGARYGSKHKTTIADDRHLAVHPEMAVSYWTTTHDTCTAECLVEWYYDDDTRAAVWNKFATAPPPVGYDPSIIPAWTSPEVEAFGILRVEPISLRVMDGSRMVKGSGRLLTWRAS